MLIDARSLARLKKSASARIGGGLVALVVALSVAGPILARHDPNVPNFDAGRGPFGSPTPPSPSFWLGTDTLFRDELARLAAGGRLSLTVAVVATCIAMAIGVGIGVAAAHFRERRIAAEHVVGAVSLAALGVAYAVGAGAGPSADRAICVALGATAVARLVRAGRDTRAHERRTPLGRALDRIDALSVVAAAGIAVASRFDAPVPPTPRLLVVAFLVVVEVGAWTRDTPRVARFAVNVDDLLMSAVDVLLSFPYLLLLMAIAAAVDSTSTSTIFWVLGLTSWTGIARVIRAKSLQIVQLDYVLAARALGQRAPVIVLKHVLPNLAGPALVLASNSIATMIVSEAALAFLGLSVPPPAASWGRMLDEGRPYYAAAPWLLLAPACAILVAVLGFNLLGEGLRDALESRDG